MARAQHELAGKMAKHVTVKNSYMWEETPPLPHRAATFFPELTKGSAWTIHGQDTESVCPFNQELDLLLEKQDKAAQALFHAFFRQQ